MSARVLRCDWNGLWSFRREWHAVRAGHSARFTGGVKIVVAGRLIPVQVGDVEIAVETVAVAGSEPTSGRAGKAAENVLGAFNRAQDAIMEVARSTAEMIARAGSAARPDRVEVQFGLQRVRLLAVERRIRSSNSPALAPARNAVISARV